MIISASRRTDIPSFYSDWFYNRIKEGYVLVRNPMNFRQISRISLAPDVVDGIVFWTKNPLPMLEHLNELKAYMYYFQFTITPYGKDIEPNIPIKKTDIVSVFKRISDVIGPDRVIWRYDPILLNMKYSWDYHVRAFEKIAAQLYAYTRKVTISFIDTDYRGVKSNMKDLALVRFLPEIQTELSLALAKVAHSYGLNIDTCAEKMDLQHLGINHARCIDDQLFEKILGCQINAAKDKSQRLECGCIASIDIGMYNTCYNACQYCYANYSPNSVRGNYARHDPSSPLLTGEIGERDKIHERKVTSCRGGQMTL